MMAQALNRWALRRSFTTLLDLRNITDQAVPARRNATTTTLLPGQVLGFPQHVRVGGKRVHLTPFKNE
jgi:hypothetical protein